MNKSLYVSDTNSAIHHYDAISRKSSTEYPGT